MKNLSEFPRSWKTLRDAESVNCKFSRQLNDWNLNESFDFSKNDFGKVRTQQLILKRSDLMQKYFAHGTCKQKYSLIIVASITVDGAKNI